MSVCIYLCIWKYLCQRCIVVCHKSWLTGAVDNIIQKKCKKKTTTNICKCDFFLWVKDTRQAQTYRQILLHKLTYIQIYFYNCINILYIFIYISAYVCIYEFVGNLMSIIEWITTFVLSHTLARSRKLVFVACIWLISEGETWKNWLWEHMRALVLLYSNFTSHHCALKWTLIGRSEITEDTGFSEII